MKKSDEFFEPFKIDQETQEKMKKRMLDLLLYFKSFCEKYNLRFWLIGGGAIGAVREHGFVPWDDDIDVQMPLPDYQRLIELWPKYGDKDRYVFCKTNREVNYHHAYISIRDPETTLICAYNKNNDICQGIGLEIGCMYPTPQSKILQYLQIINGFVYALFNNQRLPNNRGDFIRFMSKVR